MVHLRYKPQWFSEVFVFFFLNRMTIRVKFFKLFWLNHYTFSQIDTRNCNKIIVRIFVKHLICGYSTVIKSIETSTILLIITDITVYHRLKTAY